MDYREILSDPARPAVLAGINLFDTLGKRPSIGSHGWRTMR
jgi:hypothetical protein